MLPRSGLCSGGHGFPGWDPPWVGCAEAKPIPEWLGPTTVWSTTPDLRIGRAAWPLLLMAEGHGEAALRSSC
jgi:hypothetical protein